MRKSLDDARVERDAGDLSEGDYQLIVERDRARLAVIDSEIEQVHAEATRANGPSFEPTRRRKTWRALIGVVALIGALVIFLVGRSSTRLPGQSITGSIQQSTQKQIARQLTEAKSLIDKREPLRALRVYSTILGEDSREPVALAEWGWLEWQAARDAKKLNRQAEGEAAVSEATQIDPKFALARYYLGSILFTAGDVTGALAAFHAFLADKPTAQLLVQSAPTISVAFTSAHQPIPAGLPAGS